MENGLTFADILDEVESVFIEDALVDSKGVDVA